MSSVLDNYLDGTPYAPENKPTIPTADVTNNTCTWQEDSDTSYWYPSCNKQAFAIIDGTPTENEMKFCCYCGKQLKEERYMEEEDDEK